MYLVYNHARASIQDQMYFSETINELTRVDFTAFRSVFPVGGFVALRSSGPVRLAADGGSSGVVWTANREALLHAQSNNVSIGGQSLIAPDRPYRTVA